MVFIASGCKNEGEECKELTECCNTNGDMVCTKTMNFDVSIDDPKFMSAEKICYKEEKYFEDFERLKSITSG